MSQAAAPTPAQETAAKVEANLLAQALNSAPPSPELLGQLVRDSELTLGQIGGVIQRVVNAADAARTRAAAERMEGIRNGTIVDNGAGPGKSLIVHKRFSAIHGEKARAARYGDGFDPILSSFETTSKEVDEFLEQLDANGFSRKATRSRAAHHPERLREAAASSITGAAPQTQGITIPSDLPITIVDNVLAEIPWTMEENVFRTGSSEGVMGYTTKVDLDPDTEADTIDGITFTIVGEGEDAAPSVVPKLVEIRGLTKTMSASVTITRRMRKANPGVANWFIGKLANAHKAILTKKSIRGTAPFPVGFLNQAHADFAPTLVDRQTSGTISLKDLRQMKNKLPENFRESAVFVTRHKTWDALLDDVDDAQRPKFPIQFADLVGNIGLDQGKVGMAVIFSRHMPLLGATGDVCLINRGSLWTALRDDTLEILTSDQINIKSGGYWLGVFSDFGYGVMPGGNNKGIIALKTK